MLSNFVNVPEMDSTLPDSGMIYRRYHFLIFTNLTWNEIENLRVAHRLLKPLKVNTWERWIHSIYP